MWHDAWADSEQHDPQEWRFRYLVRTIGFLVREQPDVVSVAQEILPEGDGFRAVNAHPNAHDRTITQLGIGRDALSASLASPT